MRIPIRIYLTEQKDAQSIKNNNMIECYNTNCLFHDFHTNPEDGPFCSLDVCIYNLGTSDESEKKERTTSPLQNKYSPTQKRN